MSNKNYNKLYKSEKDEIPEDKPKTLEVKEQKKDENKSAIIFKVVNCSSLNVREKADKLSPVLSVISEGDTVFVNPDSIGEEWLNISTQNDVVGYVMKEYLLEV